MAEYRLTTVWRIDAPLQQVYEAICRPARWPSWWWGVKDVVELEPGDERGVGRLLRYTWKALLPYALTFTIRVVRVEPLAALEGIADGELEGTGRWRFSQEGSITAVCYEWQVRTTKRWMNLLAPIASPLFEWNHNLIMREGGKGLARLLGARLISLVHE
ncbi:MAG: SRPBCC family protein [Betaproteobacteria bacterium]|nr:SRPBCC family protein [Betaproteobacteria bacterium]